MAFAANQADQLSLEVAGYNGTFPDDFVPDIFLPDPVEELFCAEFSRMVCLSPYGYDSVVAVYSQKVFMTNNWSDGEYGGHGSYENGSIGRNNKYVLVRGVLVRAVPED